MEAVSQKKFQSVVGRLESRINFLKKRYKKSCKKVQALFDTRQHYIKKRLKERGGRKLKQVWLNEKDYKKLRFLLGMVQDE